jgi:hypothetical protein
MIDVLSAFVMHEIIRIASAGLWCCYGRVDTASHRFEPIGNAKKSCNMAGVGFERCEEEKGFRGLV